MDSCTFVGNRYLIAGGGGGGMMNIAGNPTVTNCIFAENEGPGAVAMANWDGGNPTVTNCTFVGNVASGTGGGMWSGSNSHPTASNCIFWDNVGGEIVTVSGSTATVSFSDIAGGYAGPGNINADPLFEDPVNGDYHHSAGSPCIDAASNPAVPVGVTTDLDGNPRFVDDPCRADTGNGPPPVVDMGAYEFQGCSCDLDGDGSGRRHRLPGAARRLGAVCRSRAPTCPADFDGDCTVGVTDFLILLANWG